MRAPNDSMRASSSDWLASNGRRSRWSLLFVRSTSGTATNTSRIPTPLSTPTTQKGLPGISSFLLGHPVTSLQNRAIDSESRQSNVTLKTELGTDLALHKPAKSPVLGSRSAASGLRHYIVQERR